MLLKLNNILNVNIILDLIFKTPAPYNSNIILNPEYR